VQVTIHFDITNTHSKVTMCKVKETSKFYFNQIYCQVTPSLRCMLFLFLISKVRHANFLIATLILLVLRSNVMNFHVQATHDQAKSLTENNKTLHRHMHTLYQQTLHDVTSHSYEHAINNINQGLLCLNKIKLFSMDMVIICPGSCPEVEYPP